MGKMDEIIIVAPREKVFNNEELTFQGVEDNPDKVVQIRNNISDSYSEMRRGDAEENILYKQPIPYCIIQKGTEIFTYKRLSGGGETRLHNKLSIGAGGHMNVIEDAKTFEEVLQINLERELEEELDIQSDLKEFTTIGFINDDSEEVSRVHIGLLTILDVDKDAVVEVREKDQLEGNWMAISDLLKKENYDRLESWSKIAVDILK